MRRHAEVWGLVLAIKHERTRLYVKRIGEDMGPYDDRCPLRILDLLSEPLSNEFAREWRARCICTDNGSDGAGVLKGHRIEIRG